MTFDDIIHFIQSILLGKTKPGMDADPLILFGWACVSGLFLVAASFAKPPRAPGIALGVGGLALLLSGAIVFKIVGLPVGPAAGPKVGTHKPPVGNQSGGLGGAAPTAKAPPFGQAGAGGTPPSTLPPASPSVRFTRLDNVALTGRPLEKPRPLSLIECEQRCSTDTQCAAFVHAEGICALKLDEGSQVSVPGTVSGVKAK
jgi:PAN domain